MNNTKVLDAKELEAFFAKLGPKAPAAIGHYIQEVGAGEAIALARLSDDNPSAVLAVAYVLLHNQYAHSHESGLCVLDDIWVADKDTTPIVFALMMPDILDITHGSVDAAIPVGQTDFLVAALTQGFTKYVGDPEQDKGILLYTYTGKHPWEVHERPVKFKEATRAGELL